MSVDAHVCKKYDVRYGLRYRKDDFIWLVSDTAKKYPDLVSWRDDEDEAFELDKESLTKASVDEQLDEDLREFAKKMLAHGDPNNDFVRVEIF